MQILPKYISFLKENRTVEQAKEMYHQRIEDSQEVYNKFAKDFITRDCPFCGSNEHHELERFNGQYGVVSCAKCASMFVNPSPNLDALDFYYKDIVYYLVCIFQVQVRQYMQYIQLKVMVIF